MSATYDWLPSVAPLLSAGVVKAAVSMPWKMRLTSQLQRRMIYALSPHAAGSAATVYGATAEPTSFKNVHLAAWQSAKRAAHLFDKLDRIVLRGTLTKNTFLPRSRCLAARFTLQKGYIGRWAEATKIGKRVTR
jgi:hypothetical protein